MRPPHTGTGASFESERLVNPILFIVVEALLVAFFVFGYVLYRRRRPGRAGEE